LFQHARRCDGEHWQLQLQTGSGHRISFAPATFSISSAVTGSLALSLPVRAAVAFHAVLEVLDAFLDVLATHIGRRMFVAAIAGVLVLSQ
jgi:hypothetical protein